VSQAAKEKCVSGAEKNGGQDGHAQSNSRVEREDITWKDKSGADMRWEALI
jgi:hypothetical protein